MNGIEKITQQITADTQAEIDRVLSDARAEAAQITAKFQAQAEAEARDLAAKNEKAAAEREERLEVNCTFDTLVRLQKAETAGAVAKKLFPEA